VCPRCRCRSVVAPSRLHVPTVRRGAVIISVHYGIQRSLVSYTLQKHITEVCLTGAHGHINPAEPLGRVAAADPLDVNRPNRPDPGVFSVHAKICIAAATEFRPGQTRPGKARVKYATVELTTASQYSGCEHSFHFASPA
jgi:hypothetical protein